MSDREICFLTATELSQRIRDREISASEVLEAHLAQIDRLNPKVNAIVTLVADQARNQSHAADQALSAGNEVGPLHGLPIAHKDLVWTQGSRLELSQSARPTPLNSALDPKLSTRSSAKPETPTIPPEPAAAAAAVPR